MTEYTYAAPLSRLGGWNLSALSWWDRSQDTHPGSNSTIFAPGLTITAEEMLTEAQRRFPWVFSRLPETLKGNGRWPLTSPTVSKPCRRLLKGPIP